MPPEVLAILLIHTTSPGGRHMLNELLNRKSASRLARAPFHVVSLIPRAGFQKRFIVSVLQSYAPFNVGVFKRWGERASVKTCVLYTSQLRGHAAQAGEAAMWPPGSPTWSLGGCGWGLGGVNNIHWSLTSSCLPVPGLRHSQKCQGPSTCPFRCFIWTGDTGLCTTSCLNLTHQHPVLLFT